MHWGPNTGQLICTRVFYVVLDADTPTPDPWKDPSILNDFWADISEEGTAPHPDSHMGGVLRFHADSWGRIRGARALAARAILPPRAKGAGAHKRPRQRTSPLARLWPALTAANMKLLLELMIDLIAREGEIARW